MRDLAKLYPFIQPYIPRTILVLILNFITSMLSLFSFTVFIPFLSVLFDSQQMVSEPVPFAFSGEAIKHNAYYFLSRIITEYGQLYALYAICIAFVTMILLKNISDFLGGYFTTPVLNGIPRDLFQKAYEKIISLPVSFYTEQKKGDIMSRMSSDITNVRNTIKSLTALIKNPITILVFFSTLIVISPHMTAFIVLVFPLIAFVTGKIGSSLKRGMGDAMELNSTLLVTLEETLTGLRVIKAFGAARHQIKKFSGQNESSLRTHNKVVRKYLAAHPLSEVMGISVLAVAMGFGGSLVLSGGDSGLSPEGFIYYLVVFSQIISPAKAFSTSFYNIKQGAASLDRINEILEAENTIVDAEDAKSITSFKDSVEFKDVRFSYNGEKNVLNGINFSLPKGKSVALVGQSGSGKTTIANLLPRFYDISSGNIEIDGSDIRSIKLEDLRKQMGIVTQESILFNDTIFNNIAFGIENASEEKVIEAAKIANAHQFIMESENGYQTNIGDGGGKLSGGQRQRISIARAVLKNPPILILDEATSALDTESERLVQDALEKLMANRTSLIIAHRLSTIKNADEIIVLNEGQIVERGTHEQLTEAGGTYKRLHDLQLL